jgi:hypothetical protein
MIADDPWWTSLGWSETEYRRFCSTKRFLERWRADPWFRSAVRRSPQRTFDEYGLAADPESVRAIWDAADADRLSSSGAVEAALTEAVREYRDYSQWRAVEREKARARAAPRDTRWRGFYRRQVARARTELGPAWCAEVPLLPAAFELSEGCSVGCWFCALSASRAGRHRAHDLEGRRAFRSLLQAVGELAGTPSLAQSPLYWATDPFDNPDFEEFAEDFRERAGALPRVTTALALRDLGRTRAWLSRSAAQRPTAIRFSVLRLSQLGMLHAAFTPEQLGHVELLPMNRESRRRARGDSVRPPNATRGCSSLKPTSSRIRRTCPGPARCRACRPRQRASPGSCSTWSSSRSGW